MVHWRSSAETDDVALSVDEEGVVLVQAKVNPEARKTRAKIRRDTVLIDMLQSQTRGRITDYIGWRSGV
jgi:hypothetical protein